MITHCGDNDCQGLHDLKADFNEHRKEWRRDNTRHQMIVGAIVTIGAAVIGSMTQIQIARMNKEPTHAHPSQSYVVVQK